MQYFRPLLYFILVKYIKRVSIFSRKLFDCKTQENVALQWWRLWSIEYALVFHQKSMMWATICSLQKKFLRAPIAQMIHNSPRTQLLKESFGRSEPITTKPYVYLDAIMELGLRNTDNALEYCGSLMLRVLDIAYHSELFIKQRCTN